MTDYNKMSLHELREVARVQAHELQTLRTTKFKDEFARRIGLMLMKELQGQPLREWPVAYHDLYLSVAAMHKIGARCWKEG